ncbi:MAG: hypothetical protein ACLGSA_16625 [Acidobacteriota bacterium]
MLKRVILMFLLLLVSGIAQAHVEALDSDVAGGVVCGSGEAAGN